MRLLRAIVTGLASLFSVGFRSPMVRGGRLCDSGRPVAVRGQGEYVEVYNELV